MESVVNQSLETFYKGKKIFVTGHTGFKGAWLITWLQLLGSTVKGYALEAADEKSLYTFVKSNIAIESIIGDIRNRQKLTKEIIDFQPDIVFHLAAQALVRRSYEVPSETFEINVVGTANLLEAVNQLPLKCSVIVITTDKVYENRETNYHYKEDDILGGYDPYSASKAATELVVSSFRNSFFNPARYIVHQKAIASARAGNVIGGGDRNKDRIIPDIIHSLMAEETVAVRNPSAVRPWQLVLEPLHGYLMLGKLLHEDAARFSGAYNFGPVENDHLPVKDLVNIAIKCWGKGSWIDTSDPTQPHEAGLLQLDINKAIKELNWHPKLKSFEAIEWTINWYKQLPENIFNYTLQQLKNYQQQ